jgi:hypothetical protein
MSPQIRLLSPKRAVVYEMATRGWGLKFQAMHDDDVDGWAGAMERLFTLHMPALFQLPQLSGAFSPTRALKRALVPALAASRRMQQPSTRR